MSKYSVTFEAESMEEQLHQIVDYLSLFKNFGVTHAEVAPDEQGGEDPVAEEHSQRDD